MSGSESVTYPHRHPTPALVIEMVAAASGFSPAQLTGPSRRRPLVAYRQVAMAATRLAGGWSFPAIGRAFGDRDHTTVIHAVRKVEADPALAAAARRMADDALCHGRQLEMFEGGGT